MADPKYANLPGIDLDSPDVYETNDLPESDQDKSENEDPSESVEALDISATEAHGRFKGKALDGSRIDFSDRVGHARRTGYDVSQTEYEMVGEGADSKETPQQKYQRLQHEIRELAEEVNQIKANVKADADAEKLTPVTLTKQTEYLQQQLADLHLDKLLGTQGALDLSDPQGALQKRLLSELDAFRTPAAIAAEKAAKSPKQPAAKVDGDHVTYQLYYRPEQAKFSHNARMADVEQRLERLEAVIGQSPEKLSALTAETNNKSLVGAVAVLTAKTSVLDPSQLEQLEGRIHSLGLKLAQANEKKEAVENADKQTKISELYDLVKKWDTIADTLPHVVDRLTALRDLHEQALQFSQALAYLDTAQQQIGTHITAHGDMVRQVEKTLSENMKIIQGNFKSIDDRLKAVSK